MVAIFVQWSLTLIFQLLQAVKPLLGSWGMYSSWLLFLGPRTQSLLQGLGRIVLSSSSSNMDTLNRLSFSMRGTRYLPRSWMVPMSTPKEAPNHMAHCCRAQASLMILSCLTTQMSLGPYVLNSHHQLDSSSQSLTYAWTQALVWYGLGVSRH